MPRQLILFDLEAAVNEDRDIIEIGAWKLKDLHQPVPVESFHRFVRPLSVIGKKATQKITGLSLDALQKAETFETVFSDFLSWAGEDSLFVCWGHDEQFLEAECVRYGMRLPDLHFLNLQFQYDQWVHHPYATRLCQALQECGCLFQGREHSALDDALNLLPILQFLQTIPVSSLPVLSSLEVCAACE